MLPMASAGSRRTTRSAASAWRTIPVYASHLIVFLPIGRQPGLWTGCREAYQAVEKRDLLCRASSFVIAAYGLYASFLRICAPCISSFLNSLPEMLFFNGKLNGPGLCCAWVVPRTLVGKARFPGISSGDAPAAR